jgi:hypothetical protein
MACSCANFGRVGRLTVAATKGREERRLVIGTSPLLVVKSVSKRETLRTLEEADEMAVEAYFWAFSAFDLAKSAVAFRGSSFF